MAQWKRGHGMAWRAVERDAHVDSLFTLLCTALRYTTLHYNTMDK